MPRVTYDANHISLLSDRTLFFDTTQFLCIDLTFYLSLVFAGQSQIGYALVPVIAQGLMLRHASQAILPWLSLRLHGV